MATGTTTYSDISPRTAAYADKRLLTRAHPYILFDKFGQTRPLPSKSSKTIKFRRYNSLPITPKYLIEGVTPALSKPTKTDVEATLRQMGDGVELTDVIMDTHEDPILQEYTDILGEQAPQMRDQFNYGILKAGTSVFLANGSSRGEVNTPLSVSLIRNATRTLERQNARKITKKLSASPNYATVPVPPSYYAICHTDLAPDWEALTAWTPVERYAQPSTEEAEIGKIGNLRVLTTSLAFPFEDAGGIYNGSGTAMMSTSGSSADVYPILIFGRDAYGLVPLKGKGAVSVMVTNPNKATKSDPFGQRGTVAWKGMHTCTILNDAWMCRVEVAVRETPIAA